MTIGLQEVVRSDVEGGLSGPANPIPSQSIDCGCGQMQCPKLAKFATRVLLVGLLCWIGAVQTASHAYFYVSGSTIARRFQIDPNLMDWILIISDLTPFIFGLIVAYWGDRIHRASWIGALTLLQSVAHLILIIPHLTHQMRVIEDTSNVTHMSLYADDSPELCTSKVSRIIVEEDDTCYFTLCLLIAVLIINGIANIAFYALGISYLDDNTKKKSVSSFIGVIIAVKIMGLLFGYLLGWGCLRIDAENLSVIESYQDQIGAWWLGFLILAILLIIPGLLLSWFPRRLPSEVVEQAAATLLRQTMTYNRSPHRANNQKIGNPDFWPSLGRLIINKILICNIFATVCCASALLNFIAYEDIFIQSRFHVAKPTGVLLGFNDPLTSRLITTIVKPVLIGLIVIISGLVLSVTKPRARFIIGYSFVIVLLTVVIIISLIFVTCDKPPIVGLEKGSNGLLKYCNKNCRCSKDAEFRPVCDSLGTYTYYNPCYASCTTIIYFDNVKIYSGCSCVEDMTGWGNDQAIDGPCDSMKCQVSWILFKLGTSLAYALVASTFIGDLLINIRSVYKQDKAISIGFWMMWIAIFVVLGKMLYEFVSYQTCQYWGNQKSICHLHEDEKFGNYLCYLTILLLSLCLLFRILVWYFSKNLQLYEELAEDKDQAGTEIQELIEQVASSVQMETATNSNGITQEEATIASESSIPVKIAASRENPLKEQEDNQKSVPLKYGPLGVGDRRATSSRLGNHHTELVNRNLDSEDELNSSSDESKKQSSPQIAYSPLELDSDVESDLGNAEPRSRKRISGKDYEQTLSKNSSIKRHFPNPDRYEDPRRDRNYRFKKMSENDHQDGSSKTSSFEFSKEGRENNAPKRGDFNEIGIPTTNAVTNEKADESIGTNATYLNDVKSLIDRFEQNVSQETLEEDQLSVKSAEDTKTRLENKIVSGIPLVAMVPNRSSTRGQHSSGFSSLPNVQVEHSEQRSEKGAISSPKESAKKGKTSHCTDL